MESKSQQSQSKPVVQQEYIVSNIIKDGFGNILVQTSIGLGVGFLTGLVLARGGGNATARKMITGFGGGLGLGSAWTKTSIQLETTIQGGEKK